MAYLVRLYCEDNHLLEYSPKKGRLVHANKEKCTKPYVRTVFS